MKIIREGKIDLWWVGKIIECSCCGQKVELEWNDLKCHNFLWQRNSEKDDYIQISCINCQKLCSLYKID
jgi:hypothetical protein